MTATIAGALTWERLAAGNVLGWLLLGARIWRHHPELSDELPAALRGTGNWSTREHTP